MAGAIFDLLRGVDEKICQYFPSFDKIIPEISEYTPPRLGRLTFYSTRGRIHLSLKVHAFLRSRGESSTPRSVCLLINCQSHRREPIRAQWGHVARLCESIKVRQPTVKINCRTVYVSKIQKFY